ncbi:MAG: DUF2007 domain-containing protein [Hyphomicrobiales bacterium]|nr:DUF2007 domain-containing protein [Hyphomicrobiales bacterium]
MTQAAVTAEVTMRELCSTDDPVLKSYIGALLRDARIDFFVADEMSHALYPATGVWAFRFFVPEKDLPAAVRLLKDAQIDGKL